MFFRRSPRRRRSSGLGSIVDFARSRWSHSNTERVFGLKRGYARRLSIEPLEDRRLLAITVSLDGGGDAIIAGNGAGEAVTMTIENQGLANQTLRITDPAGGMTVNAPWAGGGTTATILTSLITGGDIFINLAGGNDTAVILATPTGAFTTTVDVGAGASDVVQVGASGAGNLTNIVSNIVTVDTTPADRYDLRVDSTGDATNRFWKVSSPAAGQGLIARTTDAAGATVVGGTVRFSTAADSSVEIAGGAGDDVFTVDFTGAAGGDPLPFLRMDLRGNGQVTGDRMVLTGGTVTKLTHNFTNNNDGTVVADDFTPNNDTIRYFGLEPIIDNMVVANRVFTFNTAAPNITLTNVSATQTRIDSNQSESVDFLTPSASLTINLANGANTLTVTSLATNYNTPTNTINGNAGADIVNFEVSGAAASNWTVAGNAGNDEVNLSPTAQDLDNLLGPITFNGGGDTNTLRVFDTNDVDGNTYTITSTNIDRDGSFAGVTYDANAQVVHLDAGTGNDIIGIQSTSTAATTTIRGNNGNDTYNIQGNALGGNNNFSGNLGNDVFNVNIAAATSLTGTTVVINGDAPAASILPNQDTVNINDLNVVARNVTFTYPNAASGDVNVAGIGTLLDLNTVEQVNYTGANNNKNITVVGTAGDDLISVAPLTANSARVFIGGNPVDGPPENSFGPSPELPGVAGGSNGPDLFVTGAAAAGITVQGGGQTVSNRLYVYAPNVQPIVDANGATIIPGFGAGNAFDVITVNQNSTNIVNNSIGQLLPVLYNTTDFVQANPSVNPAVVINAGFEGNPTPTAGTDVADDIRVTLSPNYKFQINGGDPDPATTGIVPPDGDKLTVLNAVPPFTEVNVFATKPAVGPPVVTVDFGGLLPVSFSSIENFAPISATTVNLIGDNNDPTVDQNDDFVVEGTGFQSFRVFVNNAVVPLEFDNVEFLNVFGFDQMSGGADNPATPTFTDDIDTLEITPYADNTPQGWGIDVFFNEGVPAGQDGAQDLLIYHTSAGAGGGGSVSEDIIIQPSGPDNGELRVTNQAFGTPIVVISYTANTDIEIIDDDGSVTDNDSLTLRGTNPNTPQTSGNETFAVDFDAPGTGPAFLPQVTITDTNTGTILYRIRRISSGAPPTAVAGIQTINFESLDGNDTLNFHTPAAAAGFISGINQVNFFGGGGTDRVNVLVQDPTGAQNRRIWRDGRLFFDGGTGTDSLSLSGTPTEGVETVTYSPGPIPGSGRITHDDDGPGAAANQTVDFVNLEPIVDLMVAAQLIVTGTPEANAINYMQGSVVANGLVTVDNYESMEFSNKTTLIINAGAGSDLINLNNNSNPTSLTGITVNAGDPTAGSDTVVVNDVNSATQITVASIDADGATVSGAQLVPVVVNGAELLIIDGQNNGNDTLRIEGTAGDDRFVHTPGNAVDAGSFSLRSGVTTLLPIRYEGLDAGGEVQIRGGAGNDTLVARGTDGSDTVNVSFLSAGAPDVDLTTTLGVHVDLVGVIDGVGVENLVIETLADNDTIIVAAPITLTEGLPVGTLTVIGGDSDADTDKFIVNGAAATVETVIVRPDATVPTDQDVVVNGAVTDVTGVELVQYNGVGADDNLTVDFRAVNAAGAFIGTGVVDARVQNAANLTDEVLSNRLPDVRFSGVGTFTLQGSLQPTTATFVPKLLTGATGYTFASNNLTDTFVIEGNGGVDLVTATTPAANTINVATTGAPTIVATGMTATDLFDVNGLGGNDNFTVNVATGLILTPVFFDGGSGADLLTVDGAFDGGAGDITTVTYTPGTQPDRGRLQYTETVPAAQTMEINFENIEPIVDTTNADILTVNGNGAANSISVVQDPNAATRALVSVDGFETMSFNNKATLLVNGLAGDDTIVVAIAATAVITGLVALRVNGDQGNDTIRLESVPTAVTSIIVNATAASANPLIPARPFSGDGNDTIDATTIAATTALTIFGGAGNDVISGGLGNDTIDAGAGNDTIIVSPGTDSLDGGDATDDDGLVLRGTADVNDFVVRQVAAANQIDISFNGIGGTFFTNTLSDLEHFRIELGDDNDQLTIDLPNAQLITSVGAIFYDGGTGADKLIVQGAFGAASIDSVVYAPGLQVDEGRLLYTEGATVMDITFDNLEPIVDTTDAATLIVNGNGAANSITVITDPDPTIPAGTVRALVTRDGFETMSFNNKANLTLNGLSGDDTIVVDIATAPSAPNTALTSVTVNADAGNDTVRLENLPATVTTATANGGDGNDIIDGTTIPATTALTLNGGAGNDTITGGLGNDTIDGGAGNDTIIVSPGTDSLDGGDATDDDGLVLRGTADVNDFVVRQLAAANQLAFSFNGIGGTFFTNTIADLEHFRIELGDDNDLLTIDLPNALLITSVGAIFYDGGTGADSLTVQGAFGAATIDSVVYTPGLQADEGRLLYTDAGTTMDITFDNMEPVVDTAEAATLVVNGNGAANAITIVRDPSAANDAAATRALVSVDGFETMLFNNKTNLTLNALGGDDIVNVNIATTSAVTGLTNITVNADSGNDAVRLISVPTAVTAVLVNDPNRAGSGDGNDVIDGSTIAATTAITLNGGAGNDTITGGLGADLYNGGTGDDTLIDTPGVDTFNGDVGNDQIVIRGTFLNNILSAVQAAPSGTVGANYVLNVINGLLAAPPLAVPDQITTTNPALAPNNAANLPTVERIVIEALAGDDYIAVAHADEYSDLNNANGIAAQTITMQVIGDAPNASDRLVVQDNGLGDLVIHREGPDRRSGSIVVGGMAPVTYESTERVDIIPLDNAGQTGTPPGGRLLVFKDDDLETNESATNASPLGLEPAFIGQRNIDPGAVNLLPFGQIPGDEDWYEFRPLIASTFRFDIFFEHIETLPSGRPGLPEDGDLRLDVFRADGTLIASSDSSGITPINVDSKESVTVSLNPAVTQSVFVRVKGSFLAGGEDPEAPSPAINIYDIAATEVDDEGPVVFDPDGGVEAIFPNNLTNFDLFVPKPDNLLAGATPQIFSITVNIRDLPVPPFPGDPIPALDTQSASQPGIYRLVGDHVGIIDIASVELLNNFQVMGDVDNAVPAPASIFVDAGLVGQNLPPLTGQQALVGSFIQFTSGANSGQIRTIAAYNPATGQITLNAALPLALAAGDDFTITSTNHVQVRLNFREALPDDRFTLTILDSITDPGGNRLDGESDAVEPGAPTFPSGNGVPGGDFQARFTVDTRPEIGAAVAADIDIDINGNYVWDPANGQIGNDATNVDISFTMTVQNGPNGPLTTGGLNVNDLTFAGRFTNNGAGLPNRLYDQLGVYGFAADTNPQGQRWLVDLNGDGIITIGSDIFTFQPSLGSTFNVAGAIPIAGNFAAGFAGDEVGLFNAGKWGLDTNHDYVIQASEVFQGAITGIPFVGDFDGDGLDDLATFNNNTFFFDFRANGFGGNDANISFWGFPGVLDRPIAADIDQDGIDDVGLWAPRNSASLPREVSEWYFLMSDAAMAPVTDRPELVTDNATTTSFFASNLIGANAATIQGKLIRFLSGANTGQIRTVTAFNPATGQVTFTGALTNVPLNGDIFSIGGTTNTLETVNHAFSPIPFGNDIYAEFGDELAMPLIGNFDPPVAPTIIAPNTGIPGDYDNSGGVNGGDYNAWKSKFGSNSGIANGNGDSKTDAADYVLWRKFFGPGASGSPLSGPGGGEQSELAAESYLAAPADAASDDGTVAIAAAGAGVVYTNDLAAMAVDEVTIDKAIDAAAADTFATVPMTPTSRPTTAANLAISAVRRAGNNRASSADRFFTAHMARLDGRKISVPFISKDDANLVRMAELAAQLRATGDEDFADLGRCDDADNASAADSADVAAVDAVFQTL